VSPSGPQHHAVKLTANFARNLSGVQQFLEDAQAPQAFYAFLDELLDTVVPNLERFPDMGRRFMSRPVRSVEVSNALAKLQKQLAAIAQDGEVREYVMTHYLVLYARLESSVYLLSIKHHKQLAFDL
jgi:plasmid stabilization system protein ParE